MKILLSAILIIVALGAITSCTLFSGADDSIFGEAVVENIEILILESFPVQVHVVARGYVPDGCTRIDKISQNRKEKLFEVKITTRRPKDAACILVIQEFEEVVPLDVLDLSAGLYTVDVNGIRDSFELQFDNSRP